MDRWKYFDITHRDHVICNPTSIAKFDEMIQILALPDKARVLDIACGKAEFLVRIVERYGCSGVGIDLSTYFIKEACRNATARVPDASIEFREIDGANYDGPPESFDLVACLGASWIWQGHHGTLSALMGWAKPGGQILVGEPYWIREPHEQYLRNEGLTREMFGEHYQNLRIGNELALIPLYTMVSNGDDWDRYESLQWRAAETWALDNPDDADRQAVLERCRQSRDNYLRWGRDSLGWALYLFKKPL